MGDDGDIFHLLWFMVANESERICPFVPVELRIRDFRPVIVPGDAWAVEIISVSLSTGDRGPHYGSAG